MSLISRIGSTKDWANALGRAERLSRWKGAYLKKPISQQPLQGLRSSCPALTHLWSMILGESLPPSCEPQVLQDIKCYSFVESYMWFSLSKVCDGLATRLWVEINFTMWFLEIKMDTYQGRQNTAQEYLCVYSPRGECTWIGLLPVNSRVHLSTVTSSMKNVAFPLDAHPDLELQRVSINSVMRSVHMEHITSEPGIVTETRLNFLPPKKPHKTE